MSNRASQRIGQSQDTIVSIIVTKKIFPSLRKDSRHREVVNFSRRPEVQTLTQQYVEDLMALWNNRSGKNAANTSATTKATLEIPTLSATISPTHSHQQQPIPSWPKISFTIPNAKVGEVYNGRISIQGETPDRQVVLKSVQFDPDVGLTVLDPDMQQIHGSPSNDGEVNVLISFQFAGTDAASPVLQAKTQLFINPDPKSLWKNLPSDLNDPYFKPDEDTGYLPTSGDRTVVAASRRGRSHEHTGAFRDDDFFLATAGGWDILAVADGAGSAKSSRRGAQIAVTTSVEALQNSLSQGYGDKILEAARRWHSDQSGSTHPVKVELYESLGRAAFTSVKAIEEEATVQNTPAKDYSTTLLLALHKQTDFGHVLACYWVGDGAVAVYRKNQDVILLGEADSGEYAGQTRFLDKQVMTPNEVMKRITFTIVDRFTGLILMTDGVSDPKFETDNNLGKIEKWDELWSELEPLLSDRKEASRALLKWLKFWSPGNHDDRTIAVLY